MGEDFAFVYEILWCVSLLKAFAVAIASRGEYDQSHATVIADLAAVDREEHWAQHWHTYTPSHCKQPIISALYTPWRATMSTLRRPFAECQASSLRVLIIGLK